LELKIVRISSSSHPKPAAIAGGQTAIRWAEIAEECAARFVAMSQTIEEQDL